MDFETLISDLGALDTPQRRALAALTVQREITRAVGRMWALYELAGADNGETMNREQPPEAENAYAGSLDDWWHACKAAEAAWTALTKS